MQLSRCLSFELTHYELYVFPRPLRFFCGSVYLSQAMHQVMSDCLNMQMPMSHCFLTGHSVRYDAVTQCSCHFEYRHVFVTL